MSARRDSAAPARKPVIHEDDPVWQAVLRAPIDDEPLTDEELAAMQAGADGPGLPAEAVTAELRRRAEAESAGAELDELMRARLPQ
ncbi:hypothetical protein WME91_55125 [Sorangium sp. So ce269]